MRNIKNRYFDIAPGIFFPVALITTLFVVITIVYSEPAEALFSSFQSGMSSKLSWLIAICINYYLLFVIVLALSKKGRVRIGGPEAKPDFNKFSWIAMLFSAGMGIGLVYFSVAEPMLHYVNATDPASSSETQATTAIKNTFFHYGFHAWGIYIMLAIALAYFSFNKGAPLAIRSLLVPLFGRAMDRWPGQLLEVVPVLATLFGLATSLGFGAVQFSTGLSIITGLEKSQSLQIISIAGITLIATISVVTGLSKGLKILSNFNIIVALILFFLILFVGNTGARLSDFFFGTLDYIVDIPQLSIDLGSIGGESTWFQGWSMFYWAWWISWSPFVGTFIARISKGRTIREIAFFGLLLPGLFSFLWMSVLGGTALDFQLDGTKDLAAVVADDSSQGLFSMLAELPLSAYTPILSTLLVATFFITSSDSGSLVVDYMTSGGKMNAPVGQKVFWANMEGAIAISLLVGGGLTALQSAAISTGFPFSIVLVLVSISLWKTLSKVESKY